jgi:hypothetical protein
LDILAPPQINIPHDPVKAVDDLQQHSVHSLPTIRDNTLVDILSHGSAAGKSALLMLIIARALLPSTFHGVHLSGQGSAVVLFDNDDRFDTATLLDYLKSHIRDAIDLDAEPANPESSNVTEPASNTQPVDLTEKSIESLARNCLKHLHLIRSRDWASFTENLEHLPAYLLNRYRLHYSTTKTLAFIIVDGMNAFSWQRRANEDDMRQVALDPASGPLVNLPVLGNNHLISRLRYLSKLFECAVIITTVQHPPSASQIQDQAGQFAARKISLRVEQNPVSRFLSCISVAEALSTQSSNEVEVRRTELRVLDERNDLVFGFTPQGTEPTSKLSYS